MEMPHGPFSGTLSFKVLAVDGKTCIIGFQPLVGGVSMFRSWGFPPGKSESLALDIHLCKLLLEGDCLFMEVFNFVMNRRSFLGQLFRVQGPFRGVLTLDHGNRRRI